jgi:SAM-dependent methyltransferase
MGTRTERERRAYDEEDVGPANGWWHDLFRHVFECPNTLKHAALLESLLFGHASGRRVLEIGCSAGEMSHRLAKAGAAYVRGIDISESHVGEAQKSGIKGRVEFSLGDVTEPVEGSYEMICGRSILHHIDYRPVLERLYHKNLKAGGTMIFLEPLGSNILIKLYHLISRGGHTPDERPLTRMDVAWLRKRFRRCEIIPANLLSFMIGVPSSFLWSKPDNPALRVADRIDLWLAGRVPFLVPYFRAAIIVIRKTDD